MNWSKGLLRVWAVASLIWIGLTIVAGGYWRL